ncbi:MAG: hypothetical protein GY858_05510 [Candidatus Omnitrophica bacterium]|nr:hypothetical protein [Candidatus Omnitrophota bacterium]
MNKLGTQDTAAVAYDTLKELGEVDKKGDAASLSYETLVEIGKKLSKR